MIDLRLCVPIIHKMCFFVVHHLLFLIVGSAVNLIEGPSVCLLIFVTLSWAVEGFENPNLLKGASVFSFVQGGSQWDACERVTLSQRLPRIDFNLKPSAQLY